MNSPSMDVDARKTILKLQRRVDAIDVQIPALQSERETIVQSIETIRRYSGNGSEPDEARSSLRATRAKRAPKVQRGRRTRKAAAANATPDPLGDRSVAQVIREAIRAQTKIFTVVDIRAYLDARYPAVAAGITSGRLSKELYTARTAKLISIEAEAEKGGMHSYRLNPQ